MTKQEAVIQHRRMGMAWDHPERLTTQQLRTVLANLPEYFKGGWCSPDVYLAYVQRLNRLIEERETHAASGA